MLVTLRLTKQDIFEGYFTADAAEALFASGFFLYNAAAVGDPSHRGVAVAPMRGCADLPEKRSAISKREGQEGFLNFEGTVIVDRNSFMMGDFFPRLMGDLAARKQIIFYARYNSG